MIDCPCGFGKNIGAEQENCPVCGTDLKPLHRLQALPGAYLEKGIRLKNEGKIQEAREALSVAAALAPKSKEAREALKNLDSAGSADSTSNTNSTGEIQPIQKTKIPVWLYILPVITLIIGIFISSLFRPGEPVKEKPKVQASVFAQKIKESIDSSASLKNLPIQVEEKSGSITLSAKVPTPIHRELIDEIARHHAVDVPIDLGGIEVLPAVEKDGTYYFAYKVQEGDTLALLAKRFYGNSLVWQKIVDANTGKIKKDFTLSIGQVVSIPLTRSEK